MKFVYQSKKIARRRGENKKDTITRVDKDVEELEPSDFEG